MTDVTTPDVDEAQRYLEELANNDALVVVGGFDDCDPCWGIIIMDKDEAEKQAKIWLEDYLDNSDYNDEERERIEGEFGWNIEYLKDESDLRELAIEMVKDLRLDDLQAMAEGSAECVTYPLAN